MTFKDLELKIASIAWSIPGLGTYMYADPGDVQASSTKKHLLPAIYRLPRTDDAMTAGSYYGTVDTNETFLFCVKVDKEPEGIREAEWEDECMSLFLKFRHSLSCSGVEFSTDAMRWYRRMLTGYALVLAVDMTFLRVVELCDIFDQNHCDGN